MSGKTYDPVQKPQQMAKDSFISKQGESMITKIVSGKDHSILLTTDGHVFGWGDCESGKIGRMLKSRNRKNQGMMIERVHAKGAQDVFCGANHSFYVNKKGEVFAWGLNNHGQLGIGHKENMATPQKVKELSGIKLKSITGGEPHSMALSEEGEVYCWGRNDEGQCGLGDRYEQYRRE